MAEFIEVVRQYERMCNDNDCEECPMNKIMDPETTVCEDVVLSTYYSVDVEKIIMDWAAAHPEPQYPTWVEWQTENFPHAERRICPRSFGQHIADICTCCEVCAERMASIPADIAEKLGIKPKGVEKWI